MFPNLTILLLIQRDKLVDPLHPNPASSDSILAQITTKRSSGSDKTLA